MKKILVTVIYVITGITAFAQKKNIQTSAFTVLGTCIQCKNRIESTVKKMGASQSNWDMPSNMLTVSYDSTALSKEKIQQQLALAGHDNEAFQATDTAYESLPACCYYTRYKKPGLPPMNDSLQNHFQPATTTITGIVLEEDKKGKLLPLAGATVRMLHNQQGGSTDSMGIFQIAGQLPTRLEVSYVGYKKDTLLITSPHEIKVILKNASGTNLGEIVVRSKNQSTYVSSLSTFNTLNMGLKELTKAACCNLSESFETSPSVDVSYADAVTGIKQIQLLGLSGNYTQLLTENTPEIKGLAGSYGLTFIPGPWIESIQVTKGTGSVVNGYESIAGQINIEEVKPAKMDKLFINAYANNMGRLETSINLSQKINDKWSTALLAHANGVAQKNDDNNDGFLDVPIGRQFNFINRWWYANANGVVLQFALKALNDHRQAGETGFNPALDKFTTNKYGVGMDVEQYDFTGKLGYIFPQQKYKSIGLILSANTYNNHSYYGLTKYNGAQNSIYANLIYQSIIGTTAHKFRTGLSVTNEHYNEDYNSTNFKRRETVAGAFFEHTYSINEKLTAIAGLRLDLHNEYGLIVTPRLHVKYDIQPKTNLRLSAGSGFRTANIFAENAGLFASARQYHIVQPGLQYGYGLHPEKAWNYGINLIHNFSFKNKKGSFSVDAYRTTFTNQVVVDIDANPQEINFYNLYGKSYSNSIQAELNYELIKKLEMRIAYRWLDVQTNYHGQMLEKPLVAKHRAFINFAYETENKWKFDFTTQWLSQKRLPNTSGNPADKQMLAYSPAYIQMSGQVAKQIGHALDVYIGAENLTGYMQQQLFISGSQPFSPYFDGSIAWGPVNGRVIYAGLRFKIK